jgi:7,8-dihydropterin-6-yl-methyl-4-(beta-D-ribofuranosyl)aminobenzene 5'-phosphate synthase
MVQKHGLRVIIVASLCLFCGLPGGCDSPANSSQAGEHEHDAAVREGFEVDAQAAANKADDICVTVLYDNNTYDKRLKTAWGFSCLIEGLEKTILFDTGGDSRILLSNMHTLGIDPKDVNAVLISHVHYDHFGGLEGFLKQNNALTAYLPKSLPDQMKDVVRRAGAKLVEVHKPLMLCEHAYSTGELGWGLKEQSLVIRTSKGLIVVTGCAHPGVVNVVRKAKELHKDEVYLVLGGFHLCGLGESEIRDVLRGVRSRKPTAKASLRSAPASGSR